MISADRPAPSGARLSRGGESGALGGAPGPRSATALRRDDALAYFTEWLNPQQTHLALVSILRRTKRNKRFENSPFIGFAPAKSRWEIENQGFNEGKNHHGMEHISHHNPNSILIGWLLAIFALTIDRFYRLRYLHRWSHRPYRPIQFLLLLRLSLEQFSYRDTS